MEKSNVPGVRYPIPIPIPNSNSPLLETQQTLTRELNGAREKVAVLEANMVVLYDKIARLEKD